MMNWHTIPTEEVARRLASDLYGGLSQKEAAKRSLEQRNILFRREAKSASFYGRHIFAALLPLLLLIAAIAALITGETVTGYLLLFSLALSVAILYLAYSKARRIMDSAEEKAQPCCRVIREGQLFVIPLDKLCRGDVILLEEGDFVPADCRLLLADSLAVLESGITGKHLVDKDASYIGRNEKATESPNMLWAGTCVQKGFCRAMVCEVGEGTHLFATTERVERAGFDKTPLMERLKKLSSIVSAGLLGLVFLATLWGFFESSSGDFFDHFLLATAFAASCMSEFYSIFAYITAGNTLYGAISHKGAVESGALPKHAETLDAISSLDRLYVTADWFTVPMTERLVLLARPLEAAQELTENLSPEYKYLFRDGALALGQWYGASPLQGDKSGTNDKDPLPSAMKRALTTVSLPDEGAHYPLVAFGKTETGHRYGVILRGDCLVVTFLGDPDTLLPLCGYYYRNNRIEELSEDAREDITLRARHHAAAEGTLRQVSAVAVGVLDSLPENASLDGAHLENALSGTLAMEGFLLWEKALHPESLSALAVAREAGIGVTLFGDGKNDRAVTELLALPDATGTFLDKGESGAYFSLDKKEQMALLCASHEKREVVGFAGSGLHQLTLMKEADVSLSLGLWPKDGRAVAIPWQHEPSAEMRLSAYGCDALRISADMPVSCPEQASAKEKGKGGFASLLEGILRAKALFFNMRSVMAYLLFSSCARLPFVIASFFVKEPFVSAGASVLLGLILDLGVALVLALRSPTEKVLTYRHSLKRFFLRGFSAAACGTLSGTVALVCALFAESALPSREWFAVGLLAVFSFSFFLISFVTDKGKPKTALILVALGAVALAVFLLLPVVAFTARDYIFFVIAALMSLILQGTLAVWQKKHEDKF